MIKSKRQAIATHLGLDASDIEHYRYHYGLTSQPVYAFSDCYYCATKGNQKPATHINGSIVWKWEAVTDGYLQKSGYKIWKSL